MKAPRGFFLLRLVDHSGISGTGTVATGAQFSDGTCAMRWNTRYNSTEIWPSIEELEGAHGHGGSTLIKWYDEEDS